VNPELRLIKGAGVARRHDEPSARLVERTRAWLRERAAYVEFRDAVHELLADPSRANVARYLVASRALGESREAAAREDAGSGLPPAA
jgi:hypothetical protein